MLNERCLEYKMCQCVALLVLYVGLAHCFSWDVVTNGRNQLNFYSNGTLIHTEDIPRRHISSLAYDPVHNRVLFADNSDSHIAVISSFDIATKQTKTLLSCKLSEYFRFAYDPPSETIFWLVHRKIYLISLKPGYDNEFYGNSFIQLDVWPRGIAVDSCGGYIYWTSDSNIQRARFDGSEIEVVVDSAVWFRPDLVIDQQTQKMYWIEKNEEHNGFSISIESADLNGNNRKTLYSEKTQLSAASITVSKEFIYSRLWGADTYWQFPKNPLRNGTGPEKFPITNTDCYYCDNIAAYYQQTVGSRTCKGQTSLLPNVCSKVIVESVCKSTQSYFTERCDVSVCQNYCLQGVCSVSDEQPKCRCNAGYSGDRCEVDACHKHCLNGGICSLNDSEPVCQCNEGYKGERCDVSTCQDYCFQGNCSVSVEGQPKCRCNAGYSGKRCEVNACHEYCSNSGLCSLNEKIEPVCLCTEDYKGARCDIPACQDYCFQGNCSIGAEGQPKCRCYAGYSGERCELNACQGYCLNNGVCSLNADSVPVCHCTGDYEGDRCEVSVSVFFIKCFRIAPTLSTLRDILDTDVAPVTLDKEVLQLMSESSGACSLNEP